MKPNTIDAYIETSPEEARGMLQELRELLRSVAPNAKEAMKWGNPVFEEKRILFSFSAYKTHINFMPTRTTIDAFKEELKDHKTGRDTLQIPYNQPLPKTLIKKLASYRVKEVAEGSLWMHNS